MAEHDLIIRGATLYDGSGAAPRRADLAIKGGRISAIGADLGDAAETLDADGLALSPGIIDIHTHFDAQLTWDPWANPSPGLGVTTVVIGNCGFTIAPCKPVHRDITARNLCNVEGMSIDALRAGIDWDFESFPEYLDSLERRGVGPNVATFCGHSSVRTWVICAMWATTRCRETDSHRRRSHSNGEPRPRGDGRRRGRLLDLDLRRP